MSLRSYRELKVWQKSMELSVEIYRLSKPFPDEERFGMTSQVRRAAVSVSCNSAEGYGRATRGEYLNGISIAKGSLNEVDTLVRLAVKLGFVTLADARPILRKIDELQRMLGRMRTKLAA